MWDLGMFSGPLGELSFQKKDFVSNNDIKWGLILKESANRDKL